MFGLLCGLAKFLLNKTEYSIALLGLDGAGKTTLTERIKSEYTGLPFPEKIAPTIGLNVRRIELANSKLRLWDLSGETGMRKIWPNYYKEADGIIFVVDAANQDRLQEARETFNSLIGGLAVEYVPILIVANKSEEGNSSLSAIDIMQHLEINTLVPHLIKNCKVVPCSAVTGLGVKQAVEWLEEMMRMSFK